MSRSLPASPQSWPFCIGALRKVDLKTVHPKLYQSLLAIHGFHLFMENKLELSLKNCKISRAGSVRKPPHVITLVNMCHKLAKGGLSDWTEFTCRWNLTAPRPHKIVGRKATSMKLLFVSAPEQALDRTLDHVGCTTWIGSAWTDDTLSSKRLYVPYVSCKGKRWPARVKVTPECTRQPAAGSRQQLFIICSF